LKSAAATGNGLNTCPVGVEAAPAAVTIFTGSLAAFGVTVSTPVRVVDDRIEARQPDAILGYPDRLAGVE
jgi:hypothetical protein